VLRGPIEGLRPSGVVPLAPAVVPEVMGWLVVDGRRDLGGSWLGGMNVPVELIVEVFENAPEERADEAVVEELILLNEARDA